MLPQDLSNFDSRLKDVFWRFLLGLCYFLLRKSLDFWLGPLQSMESVNASFYVTLLLNRFQ